MSIIRTIKNNERKEIDYAECIYFYDEFSNDDEHVYDADVLFLVCTFCQVDFVLRMDVLMRADAYVSAFFYDCESAKHEAIVFYLW